MMMKKDYALCIVGAVMFQAANAQITLTASTHTPQLDEQIAINKQTIADDDAEYTFDELTGPNQTWDFSGVEFDVTSDADFVYAEPENNDFPEANIALILPDFFGQNKDDYMVADANALHVVGQHIAFSDEKHIYSDGFDLLRYPMTYGDTYTDELTGTIEYVLDAFPDWDKTGTVTVTADGYGNLVLPYGVITNVLRVKTVIDAEIGLMGGMLPQVEIRYDWYHMDSPVPVATSRKREFEEGDFAWYFAGISESELQTLSIDEESGVLDNLYPNPASDYIRLPLQADWYKVYDMNGRLVKSSTNTFEQQIDIVAFHSGMYFVDFAVGDRVYHKKFVVQH